MSSEPINFLDYASTRQRMRFASTLQLNTERALWALDEAASNPAKAAPAVHHIRSLMQELHAVSMTSGYMRVAAICDAVCDLIDTAPPHLFDALLARIIELRAIVMAGMQDEAATAQRLAG